MKINAKQIGFSKPFNVKPSLKIWMKTNQMTIKSLKLNALEVKSDSIVPTDPNYADTMLEIVEAEQKIAEEAVQYLAEVFKLNEKQIDHMEESITNARQLSNYVTYVAQRVQGMSDEQIRLANKKQAEKQKSEDPKK